MRVATVFWIVGSVISICVRNIAMLVLGRAIKGITIGIFSSLLPVYLAEVIPAKKRGLATSVLQWCLTWGIMIMFYICYFCAFINDSRSFRIAWGIELIPGSLLLVLSFVLPESPKWHASKSNWRAASEIMKRLNLNDSDSPDISDEVKEPTEKGSESGSPTNLNEIETVLDNLENDSQRCSYLDLVRADLRPHLIVGMITQIVTQLSGIGVLMYYLIFICEMIGLTGEVKVLSASVQYVVNVVFTIFPILLIDKLRRKDVLIYGAFSLGFCIGAVGIIMGYYGHSVLPIGGNESVVWEVTGTPGMICLALCFLFVAVFASTLSCAAWLYTNEIFPTRAKAKGSAICMSVSWTFNFILTFLAPISLKYLKWMTFCLFGVFCVIGAIIMIIWFPETYELGEDEINNLFVKAKDETETEDLEANRGTPNRTLRTQRSIIDETSSLVQTPTQRRKSESIQMTSNTQLPPPSTTSSPRQSTRNRTTVTRNLSTRSLVFGTNHSSPFFSKEQSQEETETDNTNRESGLSPHYYNLGSNSSPFLKNYDSSNFSR